MRVTRIKIRENSCEIGAKFVKDADQVMKFVNEALNDGLPPSSILLPQPLPKTSGDDLIAAMGEWSLARAKRELR